MEELKSKPLFQKPIQTGKGLFETKKSKFYGYLIPLQSDLPLKGQIQDNLQMVSQEVSDARHICRAFIFGPPSNPLESSCDDAGEPKGTAGKPLLHLLQKHQLGDTLAIVARKFGGIKLGASGLMRAYPQPILKALHSTPLIWVYQSFFYQLILPPPLEGRVRNLLEKYKIHLLERTFFGEKIHFKLGVDNGFQELFLKELHPLLAHNGSEYFVTELDRSQD